MEGEKTARIQSLNQSETEVLHHLFKDPNFKVIELSRVLNRSEGGIRTNLTAVFDKLEAPEGVNKREWVVREYAEAYESLFKREEWQAKQAQEPEIFIKPYDPIIETIAEVSEAPPAPAQPRIQYVYVTETPAWVFVIGIPVFAFAIIWGVKLWFLEVSSIPADSEILYAEDFSPIFNGQLSPDIFHSGSYALANIGYLTTDDKVVLVIGDNRWVNYTIYARIYLYGCELKEGEQKRYSTIGVRYNASGVYSPAYSWQSCQSNDKYGYRDIKITMDGQMISVRRLGVNEPIFATVLPQTGNESGALYFELDRGSAIDHLLVIREP
jgi:hypothetical protein